MTKPRRAPPRNSVGVSRLSPNTSVDNRLTHASLLLGYLFDQGVDLQGRVINLTGAIDEDAFRVVDAALSTMEAESKSTVTVKINSPGGEVYQALAIVGRLRESKCNIVTVGYGAVMSAAVLVLACGNRRKMSRYAWFMHHEMSYGIEDGRHSEIKAMVSQAEREQELWCQYMAEFTKKQAKFWNETGLTKDTYFTASELEKLGVVDEVF